MMVEMNNVFCFVVAQKLPLWLNTTFFLLNVWFGRHSRR